jgi:choloylglycine hydrolase
MKRTFLIHRLLVLLLLGVPSADACSTFCFEHESGPIFGKNYDWGAPDGILVVNHRSTAKRALNNDRPAEWTSRYGSVTFNQYGREFPCGGMNEAGLVVELMWLEGSEYPKPDARPSVGVLQWIQYQLDTAGSVEEVLASDAQIRVSGNTPLHYLIADKTGACATVEFLNGELLAHTGDGLPVRALTNHRYARSLVFLERHEGYGGNEPIGRTNGSLDRFVRAASLTQALETDSEAPVDEAFAILADVAQGDHTQWSIVYELSKRIVHFRTQGAPKRRFVRFSELDFACAAPVRVLDLRAPLDGDIAGSLVPYTRELNWSLVEASYSKTDFLGHIPGFVLAEVARYPESTRCASVP